MTILFKKNKSKVTENSMVINASEMSRTPPDVRIMAALVKRLGGEVILADPETDPHNFKKIKMNLSKNGSMIIKVE